MLAPRLVPGGGAVEMIVSQSIAGDLSYPDNSPYHAIGKALGLYFYLLIIQVPLNNWN